LATLVSHYAYLDGAKRSKKNNDAGSGEAPGEYAQLLEEEQFPFVLTEQYMVPV
jgi:V-type H+-transporting ATPase subunit C